MRPDTLLNPELLNSLNKTIENLVPDKFAGIKNEIQDAIKSTFREILSKMDLVTREEFDIQSELLSKTRIKLENLEQKLAALETNLKQLEDEKA